MSVKSETTPPTAYNSQWCYMNPQQAAEKIKRLTDLVSCLVQNKPEDAISDAGHTVYDLWQHDARRELNERI